MIQNNAIIILAGGASTRLGQSKQLLKKGNYTFLENTIAAALKTDSTIYVVLGANAHAHRKVINHLSVTIIEDINWSKGMGHTLKTGLKAALQENPSLTSVMVLVCDQPALSGEYLQQLLNLFNKSNKLIAASSYDSTLGVPAIFQQILFDSIFQLPDEAGAKRLLAQYPKDIESIKFQDGEIDIDTPKDYELWLKKVAN
jgi:molybdenum cofactor cytidylyltransferase